jgi:hypothetical protein
MGYSLTCIRTFKAILLQDHHNFLASYVVNGWLLVCLRRNTGWILQTIGMSAQNDSANWVNEMALFILPNDIA